MDGARAAQRCRLFGVAGAVIGTALVCSAALLLRGPSDPAGHAAAVDLASESGLEKRRPQPSPLDKPPRRTLEYEWVVTSVWDRRPDCMAVDERWPRRVLLVNGQHIGPHINVTRGDIVKVKVTNMIEARDFGHNEMHGITIHWHGLKQRSKTQWSDGVGWLTQCPIGYNRSYTYVLDTAQDSVGTHWWHAHTGSDNADGMYGAFVVREPANRRLPKEYAYDADLPVLFVQGWWNYSAPSLEWGLQQQELRWVANAQSILMNGKGVNGPSLDKRAEPGNSAGCDLDSLDTWWTYDIQPGRTYRLRVVAAGTLLPINITMPGHRMTIIEADGAYVQPLEVDELLVNLGQRYSVLFTADQPVGNYEIVASVYGRQARSGQCALEYRKSFEYEWEAGTFSTTQSCGGLDPAEAGVDAARRAALDGQAIETNFRLPSGLAVLHYTGAPYSLARLHQGRYGSEEEKLRARTINWVQNLTIAQRDALSRRVAAFENRLRANTNLNSYDSGQKLPTSRGAVPRVDMALTTWWPGKLPQRWHDDALPGYITAPTLADGPGVRAGALPVYKWAVNNVTQAFGAKRGVASARGLPVETQFYAKTVQGYEITPDYELWPKPGDGPNPTYTLGVFAWQLDFGAIVDFVIYNDDLAEEHPWHMHGYCFHVLGHGTGKFSAADRSRLNWKDPVCRDTTQVLPDTWAYIRVRFDNPGVWYFHCHMDWHLELGLGALMMVKDGKDSAQRLPRPASLDDYRMCNALVSSDWNADGYRKFGTGGWTGLDKKPPGDAPAAWRQFGDVKKYDQLASSGRKDALQQTPPPPSPSSSSHGRRHAHRRRGH